MNVLSRKLFLFSGCILTAAVNQPRPSSAMHRGHYKGLLLALVTLAVANSEQDVDTSALQFLNALGNVISSNGQDTASGSSTTFSSSSSSSSYDFGSSSSGSISSSNNLNGETFGISSGVHTATGNIGNFEIFLGTADHRAVIGQQARGSSKFNFPSNGNQHNVHVQHQNSGETSIDSKDGFINNVIIASLNHVLNSGGSRVNTNLGNVEYENGNIVGLSLNNNAGIESDPESSEYPNGPVISVINMGEKGIKNDNNNVHSTTLSDPNNRGTNDFSVNTVVVDGNSQSFEGHKYSNNDQGINIQNNHNQGNVISTPVPENLNHHHIGATAVENGHVKTGVFGSSGSSDISKDRLAVNIKDNIDSLREFGAANAERIPGVLTTNHHGISSETINTRNEDNRFGNSLIGNNNAHTFLSTTTSGVNYNGGSFNVNGISNTNKISSGVFTNNTFGNIATNDLRNTLQGGLNSRPNILNNNNHDLISNTGTQHVNNRGSHVKVFNNQKSHIRKVFDNANAKGNAGLHKVNTPGTHFLADKFMNNRGITNFASHGGAFNKDRQGNNIQGGSRLRDSKKGGTGSGVYFNAEHNTGTAFGRGSYNNNRGTTNANFRGLSSPNFGGSDFNTAGLAAYELGKKRNHNGDGDSDLMSHFAGKNAAIGTAFTGSQKFLGRSKDSISSSILSPWGNTSILSNTFTPSTRKPIGTAFHGDFKSTTSTQRFSDISLTSKNFNHDRLSERTRVDSNFNRHRDGERQPSKNVEKIDFRNTRQDIRLSGGADFKTNHISKNNFNNPEGIGVNSGINFHTNSHKGFRSDQTENLPPTKLHTTNGLNFKRHSENWGKGFDESLITDRHETTRYNAVFNNGRLQTNVETGTEFFKDSVPGINSVETKNRFAQNHNRLTTVRIKDSLTNALSGPDATFRGHTRIRGSIVSPDSFEGGQSSYQNEKVVSRPSLESNDLLIILTPNSYENIPGTPGVDFLTLSSVPITDFYCEGRFPGYYADPNIQAACQVFHVCHKDGRMHSFLCPVGTVFNQKYLVCDWWFNFECSTAEQFYFLNQDIGQSNTNSKYM